MSAFSHSFFDGIYENVFGKIQLQQYHSQTVRDVATTLEQTTRFSCHAGLPAPAPILLHVQRSSRTDQRARAGSDDLQRIPPNDLIPQSCRGRVSVQLCYDGRLLCGCRHDVDIPIRRSREGDAPRSGCRLVAAGIPRYFGRGVPHRSSLLVLGQK